MINNWTVLCAKQKELRRVIIFTAVMLFFINGMSTRVYAQDKLWDNLKLEKKSFSGHVQGSGYTRLSIETSPVNNQSCDCEVAMQSLNGFTMSGEVWCDDNGNVILKVRKKNNGVGVMLYGYLTQARNNLIEFAGRLSVDQNGSGQEIPISCVLEDDQVRKAREEAQRAEEARIKAEKEREYKASPEYNIEFRVDSLLKVNRLQLMPSSGFFRVEGEYTLNTPMADKKIVNFLGEITNLTITLDDGTKKQLRINNKYMFEVKPEGSSNKVKLTAYYSDNYAEIFILNKQTMSSNLIMLDGTSIYKIDKKPRKELIKLLTK